MLTLSPVFHGRLRTARRVQNLLLQTLVIHPALLFFLLFLLGAHSAGGAGQWLVNEAERLVRDAPAGQVWSCVPPAGPPASARTGTHAADLKHSHPSVLCARGPLSHEAWAAEANSRLLFLYRCGVVFSGLSGLVMVHFRRREKGENV